MLGRLGEETRIAAVFALALILQLQSASADNRLSLKKYSDNLITVELSNAEPIAGFQFSIHGRGGFTFGKYEGSDRATAAGLEIYQYSYDDSTVNVVILAPFRSSLPAGEGIIGKISFTLAKRLGPDTVRVFLTRVVICNADAKVLDVSAGQLTWTREDVAGASAHFALEQNFPNPFNPSTTIAYWLGKPAKVRLVIYDVAGRQVRTLVDQFQLEGRYSVRWNVDDHADSKPASGMYLVRLQVGDQATVNKMILTK